jgi:hypothetical protein
VELFFKKRKFGEGDWVEKSRTQYRVTGIKLETLENDGKPRYGFMQMKSGDIFVNKKIKMKNYGDYTKITDRTRIAELEGKYEAWEETKSKTVQQRRRLLPRMERLLRDFRQAHRA